MKRRVNMGMTKKTSCSPLLVLHMNSLSTYNSVTLSTMVNGATAMKQRMFEMPRTTMKKLTDLLESLSEERMVRARRMLPTRPRVTMIPIEMTFAKKAASVRTYQHTSVVLSMNCWNSQ